MFVCVCLQSGGAGSKEHPAGATAQKEPGGRLEQQRYRAGQGLRCKFSCLRVYAYT